MWLSAGELVVVGILALLVFGPEKLPELARQLARFVTQLQHIATEVRRNVDEVIREDPMQPEKPQHVGLSPAEQEHERYMLAAAKANENDAHAANLDDAKIDEPASVASATEESATDQATSDEPATNESATDQATSDEPATDRAAVAGRNNDDGQGAGSKDAGPGKDDKSRPAAQAGGKRPAPTGRGTL